MLNREEFKDRFINEFVCLDDNVNPEYLQSTWFWYWIRYLVKKGKITPEMCARYDEHEWRHTPDESNPYSDMI